MPAPLSWQMPLAGLTLLAVEDSRFTCEALRLLAGRSGARLRRADTLSMARRHLQVYQPDVVIIDLGLPDGSGADLIADLAQDARFAGVLLAISGDPDNRDRALAAGAVAFIEKPIESLAAFQRIILQHLPEAGRRPPAPDTPHRITPDRQALHDDLAHAADLLACGRIDTRRYVAAFVHGLARASHDASLETAARQAVAEADGMQRLAQALQDRLAEPLNPFG